MIFDKIKCNFVRLQRQFIIIEVLATTTSITNNDAYRSSLTDLGFLMKYQKYITIFVLIFQYDIIIENAQHIDSIAIRIPKQSMKYVALRCKKLYDLLRLRCQPRDSFRIAFASLVLLDRVFASSSLRQNQS